MFYQRKPVRITELKLLPNTNKQDGCNLATLNLPPLGSLWKPQHRGLWAQGQWWPSWTLAFGFGFVFNLITLLEVTVQFQPAFYTSEVIIRSCHIISPVPNISHPLQKLF